MSDPDMIRSIKAAVTIPVMAKVIVHFFRSLFLFFYKLSWDLGAYWTFRRSPDIRGH